MTNEDQVVPPEPAGEPSVPSPWAPWEQAGWDPANANPYEARQAVDYYKGLQDRDQRDFYLEQTLRGHELPEGMSWAEAREAIQSVARAKANPWEQFSQEPPQAADDGYQYGGGDDFQAYTPEQLDQVMQARIQEALAAERQRSNQERQQQQLESDFGREYERLQSEHSLYDYEAKAIGSQVASQIGVNPAASVKDLFAQAHAEHQQTLEKRFAEMAMRQQGAPNTASPTSTGQVLNPNQAPSSLDELRQRTEEMFNQ